MALGDSPKAIGAVTELLQVKLTDATNVNVTVGRPEAAVLGNSGGDKLNLFLYYVEMDPHLKNVQLDPGQPAPLWLVLHYLLTPFDDSDSDSSDAHRLLGQGLTALQALNYLAPSDAPLTSNPEPLKLTFDQAVPDLLSKLMQGSEEKYRLSAAFQVRPVMLMPDTPAAYAPAVKSVGPSDMPGVVVLPSLGPRLIGLSPERFEVGARLTLSGQDLSNVTEVCIGTAIFPAMRAGQDITAALSDTAPLSAGSYPVTAVRILPTGRRFASNALLGHLLPSLTGAAHGPLTDSGGKLHGDLLLTGKRLGGPDDSIFVAFYREGATALLFEAIGTAAQDTLTVTVTPDQALTAGTYYILLRVNGEQALNSPEIDWT